MRKSAGASDLPTARTQRRQRITSTTWTSRPPSARPIATGRTSSSSTQKPEAAPQPVLTHYPGSRSGPFLAQFLPASARARPGTPQTISSMSASRQCPDASSTIKKEFAGSATQDGACKRTDALACRALPIAPLQPRTAPALRACWGFSAAKRARARSRSKTAPSTGAPSSSACSASADLP